MQARLLLLILVFLGTCHFRAYGAESDWQVVSLEGRDYLTIENVAKFYQLSLTPGIDAQHVTLSDARVRLETVSNSRELYVNGVKQWLSFPVLVHDGTLLVSRFDLAKTIDPCLRPAMINNLEPFDTVVLDAGHGGQDGGGHTLRGFEKDYTLDVINGLKASLEAKGLRVLLTRGDDEYLSLEHRAELANAVPNAVFVSVHFNSGEAEASGVEVYAMTPRGAASTSDNRTALDQLQQMPGNDFDSASLALANCVHHAVLGDLGVADRGVKRARFAVLRLTHAPAILVEGGFMTSGNDSRQITDPVWREKLAESIAVGVRGYRNLVQYKETPKLLADYRAERLLLAPSTGSPMVVAFHPVLPRFDYQPVNNQRSANKARPAAKQGGATPQAR